MHLIQLFLPLYDNDGQAFAKPLFDTVRGELTERFGGVTAFAWLLGTILAVALGGAFARLARQYPDLNSPDDYVRPALGRDMGFLATTLYWISSWMGNNAIAVAAFGYLVILLPIDDGGGVRLVGQVVLIWLMLAWPGVGARKPVW